ncbi:amino acid adenylation domain-containing protein [Bacillus thuringiensis]|uniref:non-ribosomal peptide synthetase n=1 Tax=Bacillus thuringiensis TaxID=1428 RepID=UPI002853649B|nr:non-ribosomal peptide synthetase [Bacillus thuringiensis]MCU5511195.1 amino acid adenylation domain-containing protein [Bacillus cereus]MDR4922073.1 amino acid adenylation domain-containing protein [Bacillus thuringiensis]MED3579786.1 amino acid adenylation domain-containing protein [Bacillus thuringiensis]MED3583684.1 amino acid adenylation domain-containing protein [Bacillus thuringiensis]HDR4862823.1 amino acid adenylation domain-containing protein [Bacillus cereus]
MTNEECYRLSHPQRRIWYTEVIHSDKGICNLRFLFKLHRKMNYSKLNQVVNRVISENDGLCIRLKENGHQEPKQYFIKHKEQEFEFFDFSNVENTNLLEEWIEQKTKDTFTLFNSDLYYFALIKLNDNECAVFGNVHHIIMDGLSIQIFTEQIAKYYYEMHNENEEGEIKNSYVQFLTNEQTYLNSSRFQKDQKFWLEEFKTLPSVTGLKPYNTYQVSTKASRETFILTEHLKRKTEKFSEDYKISLYNFFVAAFSLSMYRWTSSLDIGLGMAYGNRMTKMERKLIGMMVSTVPLRMDIDPEEEVLSFISRVSRKQSKLLRHQKYPFDLLLKQINKENNSNVRLFGTTIDYRDRDESGDSLWIPNHEEVQDFAVHIENLIDIDSLHVHIDYREELFSKEEIKRFFNVMLAIMENTFEKPKQKVAEIEIISEEDKRISLVEFNNPKLNVPPQVTIHEIFEQQAMIYPNTIAVTYEQEKITYKELNERANQLAHYLQKKGVGPDTLVGICVERSLEMIVGILGVLKAGGAYVPLDPTYPEQRLQYILEDASIQLFVTQESLKELKWLPENVESICLDRDQDEIGKESKTLPLSDVGPKNLAYVIYTSGSTGNPKGVMIEHHNVIRLFKSTDCWYQFNEKDTWTLFHSYAFDFSVWEIWGALLYGGKLVVVPYWISRSPKDFYQLLVEEEVTVLNQTPSAFRQLIRVCEQEDKNKNLQLRYVIFGGEALEPISLLPWFQRYGEKNPQLINMYGITETTVHVTYYPITLDDVQHASRSNIGKRIPDLEVYILDAYQQPVPIGVDGELYIGGAGLARGYLNRPELTAERFISHPFSSDPKARLYRTGDLARYLPDGNLDYRGRIDHQVKIRGFRIEIGEIESTLHTYVYVKEAVVIVREDQPGDKRLVAYVVGDGNVDGWREYLKAKLPSYMVPSGFVAMEAIPLTANGKVDREALPMPEEKQINSECVGPRNSNEQILTTIWKRVLGVKNVGIYDNFFEIGGDSILSIQIISQASQVGLKLTPKQMFECPTIAELAQVAIETQGVQAEQGIVIGDVPLTPIQCWFFEQEHPHTEHWNQSMLLRVKERLDVKLLEGAILNLLKHHDALRFRYEQLPNGTWRQRNEETDELSVLHVVKRNQVNEKEWNTIIQEEMNINQASFNLVTGPLMRVVYFEDNLTGNDRIFWVIHHLVVDGVSWRILLEDLQVVYNQMKQGQEVRLPAKSTSFKEWSERLQTYSDSGISKEVQNYWNQQVEKETMKIPMDYPIQETTEESIDQVTRTLGIEETHELLHEVPVTHKTRIDEVLLTALGQAIVDCTNQQTVSIHLEGHGREEVIEGIDLSRTVGWFTSIYPVHLNFQGTQTPIEGLKSVKEQLRRIPNRGVDYGILRYLNKGLLPFYQQKPSISFNYLGQFDQVFSRESLFMQETGFTFLDHAPDSKPSHLIDVIGMVKDEKLHFVWMYSREQFSKLKIQLIADGMLRHLRQLINKPTTESAFTVSDFADAEDLTEESLSKVLLKLKKKRV